MRINVEKLKCYRKRTGLSSQEFAFVCDIPIGTYFSYESGQRNPKQETINIIAKKLGITVEDLTSVDDEFISNIKKKQGKSKDELAKERMIIDYCLLRTRRKQLGLKTKDVAKYVGLSESRYREYEQGNGRPTRAMTRKMCDILNSKFYELVIE